jgi:hypothetical protein
MKWQPIETAPNSQLILAWMEGYEFHSSVRWARFGPALIALHDGVTSKHSLSAAIDRIMGPEIMGARHLEPTHWMPLPQPPEPES